MSKEMENTMWFSNTKDRDPEKIKKKGKSLLKKWVSVRQLLMHN
jgi:hypothetical protein